MVEVVSLCYYNCLFLWDGVGGGGGGHSPARHSLSAGRLLKFRHAGHWVLGEGGGEALRGGRGVCNTDVDKSVVFCTHDAGPTCMNAEQMKLKTHNP